MAALPPPPPFNIAVPPPPHFHYGVRRLRRSHMQAVGTPARTLVSPTALALLQHIAFSAGDKRYELSQRDFTETVTSWRHACERHFEERASDHAYSLAWVALAFRTAEEALAHPINRATALLVGAVTTELGEVAPNERVELSAGVHVEPPEELRALTWTSIDIDVLCVLPAHHGNRCGTRLIDAVAREALIAQLENPVLVLHVDPVAHRGAARVYEHYGFRLWSNAAVLGGRPHLTLYKRVLEDDYEVFDDKDDDSDEIDTDPDIEDSDDDDSDDEGAGKKRRRSKKTAATTTTKSKSRATSKSKARPMAAASRSSRSEESAVELVGAALGALALESAPAAQKSPPVCIWCGERAQLLDGSRRGVAYCTTACQYAMQIAKNMK